jgi:hypothetical protein
VQVFESSEMNLSHMKPTGIPILVTIYGAVLALIGIYLGIAGLFDPTTAVGYVEGGDMIAGAWSGRTLGLALATALALWFRTAQAYTIVFLASVCREGGDIVGALNADNTGVLTALVIFVVLDFICLILSLRALTNRN